MTFTYSSAYARLKLYEGSKLSSSSFEFEFELARTFCRWQVPKPSSYL